MHRRRGWHRGAPASNGAPSLRKLNLLRLLSRCVRPPRLFLAFSLLPSPSTPTGIVLRMRCLAKRWALLQARAGQTNGGHTHPWGGWGAPRVLLRLCPRLCGLAQRTIEATLRCCRIRLQSSLPHNHEGLRPTTSPKLFAQSSAGSGRQAHQNPLVLLHFLLQMLPIAAHMSMRVSEQGSGRMLGLKKNAEGLPGDAEPDHGADACCEEHQRSTSVVQLWRRWLLQGRGRGVCLDKCPGRRTVRARTASSVCFDDRISAHHVAEVR